MKIRDFTEPELDMFRKLCNLTDDERQYFEYRAKDYSNITIALNMNISDSQVSKLARRVKNKMIRVL